VAFPKRISKHVIADLGWLLVARTLPDTWIKRLIAQNDYGIDGQVELVSRNGDVTGDIAFVQVKASAGIKWKQNTKGKQEARLFIRKATVNYWMGIPVPVFLLWADVSEAEVHFAPVKTPVRQQYIKFATKESIPFSFVRNHALRTEEGMLAFVVHYNREKHYEEFHSRMRELLLHWEEYLEFILQNIDWEDHEVIEVDDQMKLEHLYTTCKFAAQFFAIDWTVPALHAVYKAEAARWKRPEIHGVAMGQLLAPIEPIFRALIEKGRRFVLEGEGQYWKYMDRPMYFASQILELRPPHLSH
jgi:hypothetical protein